MKITGQSFDLSFPLRIESEEGERRKKDGQQVEKENPTEPSEINSRRELRVDLEGSVSSCSTEKSDRSTSRVAGRSVGAGVSIVVRIAVSIAITVATLAKVLAPLIVLVGWVIAPTTALSTPKFGLAVTLTFVRLAGLRRSAVNLVSFLVVSRTLTRLIVGRLAGRRGFRVVLIFLGVGASPSLGIS